MTLLGSPTTAFVFAQLFALLGLAALFYAAGDLLVGMFRPPIPRALGRVLPRLAFGIIAWMVLLFLLAAVGLYRAEVLWVVAIGTLLGWLSVVAWQRLQERRQPPAAAATLERGPSSEPLTTQPPGPRRFAGPVATFVVGMLPMFVVVCCFVLALTPAVGWDDNVYHLTLPKRYLAHGGFHPVPFSLYSHWPHGIELIYGLALALRDQVLAKHTHTLFLLLLLVTVYRLVRARAGVLFAVSASLVVAGNQVVIFEATVAYVDLAYAFFFLLATAFADAYLEEERDGFLVAAGVCCGAVAATKLSGLSALACIGFVVVLLGGVRRPFRRWVLIGLALGLPTLLLAVPWYIKSYLYTGNPLYPMFYTQFGGIEWDVDLGRRFFSWQRSMGMGRAWYDYMALPMRVVLEGGRGEEHFSGSINHAWLVIGPLALFASFVSRRARTYALAALFYFVFWALSSQQMRFLIAALPLLAVAAALGVQALLERAAFARAVVGTASLLAVAHATWPAISSMTENTSQMLSGLIAHGPPNPGLALPTSYAFINRKTPPNAKLMLLNTNRGFFLQRDYIADSAFQASQMNWLLQRAESKVEGHALLVELGITHLYIDSMDWGIQYPTWLGPFLRDQRLCSQIYACRLKRCALFELILNSTRTELEWPALR